MRPELGPRPEAAARRSAETPATLAANALFIPASRPCCCEQMDASINLLFSLACFACRALSNTDGDEGNASAAHVLLTL